MEVGTPAQAVQHTLAILGNMDWEFLIQQNSLGQKTTIAAPPSISVRNLSQIPT